MAGIRHRVWLLLALTGIPFLASLVLVAGDLAGWALLPRPLRYHGVILLDAAVAWALLYAIVRAVARRRQLAGWLRSRWKHLLLAGFTSLLALATLELALRILVPALALPHYGAKYTRALHHGYEAHARMFGGLFDGAAVVVETNEDGLRTPYSRADFLRMRDRVVVLGDSFTFGYGVQEPEAFPAVLERDLRRRLGRDDIGVLGTGVVSYSPLLERNFFARVAIAAYRPTLTIMVLDVTDIGDDFQYGQEAREEAPGALTFDIRERGMPQRWYDRIALAKVVEHYATLLARPASLVKEYLAEKPREDRFDYYSFAVRIGGTIETNRFFILRHPLADTEPYFRATLEHITRTAEAARRAGSEFVLVVAPRYHQWNDRECPNNWEAKSYRVDEPYEMEYLRFFDEAAPRLPFEVFSLLPALQQATAFPLCFSNDPHWNRQGHAVVGAAIAGQVAGRYVK